ncbi:hypothetical protein DCS_00005 [Drechmeria coniospora]|uniref:DDE-1 domain-containing protein n=1 Tax=Drechmeria coniospora TaxID=98403 RepID=A0A151GP78_DRECN|nr:hypothetical protein DCS_00005 [Drechmeria coniospora]KYK58878.1 hypothetical protein DCS_00005 [Drechmeria coniospora]
MDETGILEGLGSNGLVLGSSKKKIQLKKRLGSRCWTTIVECVSATGQALMPLVLFKGKDLQHQWFPEKLAYLDQWRFAATDKGWTSDAIALKWLKEVFIPGTKASKTNKRLLIVDGHGSHTTDDFMYECFDNGIFLLFLPAHASYVLQPLDVSCFSPIKAAYRRAIEAIAFLAGSNDTTPIGKATFLQCYYKARTEGLTERNIKGGWKGSGLWPVNIAKPLMSRLLLQTDPPAVPEAEALKRQLEEESDPFRTPYRSYDVKVLIAKVYAPGQVDRAARRLFWKIGRGLDAQNTTLAEAQAKIAQLEYQVYRLKPLKKQKVAQDPNERFAQIEQIVETRARLQRVLDPAPIAALTSSYEFESLCFEWQLE